MPDPLVGTWKLNAEKSEFDKNHQPRGGTMIFELNAAGHYLMKAEGITQNGEKVIERPLEFILDGNSHPLAGAPGLSLWRLGRTRTRSWAKSENKMARSSVVERIRFRSMGSCWHRVPSVGTLNCVNSNSTLCGSGSKRVCVEHGLMSRVGGLSQSPRRSA